jgi:excisionase family DNA binding protein
MSTRPIPDNTHILNVTGAAAYLKLAKVTIYRLASTGRMPCQRVGGQYRFTTTALDAWLMGDRLLPEGADATIHHLPVAVER